MNNFSTYLEYTNLKTKNRMPGFIAAKRALLKGETIGILTARSNKEGHQGLINRLEKSLGGKMNIDDIHFINDAGYNGTNNADKKLNVLKNYLKKYKQVKFYDDEEKNINIVNSSNISGIKAYDIKQFDHLKLKEIKEGKSNKSVIHLFDLDGTIWKLPAFIKIIKNNNVIKKITQEQFAEGYELQTGESFDFSDFGDTKELSKFVKNRNIFKA